MRWPRRHKTDEAERQLADMEVEVVRVRARWPRVRHAAGTMDAHLAENGFTDLLRIAMGVDRDER